ncbi:MAG: Crp/Fnr family transcriptional regulator [Desulfonauticus sp.]|nr:Crp/Fnr family transcriptional regulator [Desulfonauticus sp.]
MDIKKYLQQVNLFKNLREADLDYFSNIVILQNYKKGETIFNENEEAKGFFAVIRGRIKIYKTSFTGREHILHILEAGEIFAEVAVFLEQTYPAQAVALADSDILFFPKDEFKLILQQNSHISFQLLGLFALRLQELVVRVEALSLKEVPARLASYLLLRKKQNQRDFVLNISRQNLASLLGTIPETISRVIKKFQDNDIVLFKQNKVILKDVNALEEIALGIRKL